MVCKYIIRNTVRIRDKWLLGIDLMARGGIDKARVAQAREAIIGKGQRPSIDAVRIELGNTGSKSTIHRYLRELDKEESTKLDDEALLSQPIKELIARLACRLKEEAQTIVEDNSSRYESQITQLSDRCAALTQDVEQGTEQQNALARQLDASDAALAEKAAACKTLEKALSEAKHRENNLGIQLQERQKRIESLEEKHRHSREALEHYRHSVKEQRDQDQRRHEQQVQQLQAENRALNQTISLKQTDLTLLHKDNARLAAELEAAREAEQSLEVKLKRAETTIEQSSYTLNARSSELQRYIDSGRRQAAQIEALMREAESAQEKIQEFTVAQAKLESELAVKNDLITRLMAKMQHSRTARRSKNENQ